MENFYQLFIYIRLLFTANVFLFSFSSLGQQFHWIKPLSHAVPNYYPWSVGRYMATDPSGNSYVIGEFTGTIKFASNETFTSSGLNDIFVSKYDSSGNCLWTKTIGSSGEDQAQAIFYSNSENIYITAGYSDTAMFGNIQLAPGVYLAKMDNAGNTLWAKNQNILTPYHGFSLAEDNEENIYHSVSSIDRIYLSKLDSHGTMIWTRHVYASSIAQGSNFNNIGTDQDGNSYLASFFEDTLHVDGSNTTFISKGFNFFILSYDTDGNLRWINQEGGNKSPSLTDCSVDLKGNIYLGGFFQDEITIQNTTLAGTNYPTGFAAKLNSSGKLLWINKIQSDSIVEPYLVTNNHLGEFYISGIIREKSNTPGNFFIVKYNSNGNLLWYKKTDGYDAEQTFDIAIDSTNACYIIGINFSQSYILDKIPFDRSYFIARIKDTTCTIFPNELTIESSGSLCPENKVLLNVAFPSSYLYEWQINGISIEGKNESSLTVTQPGTYSIHAKNGKCIASSPDFTIMQATKPNANIISIDSIVCDGKSITVTAESNNDYNYSWYRNGNSIHAYSNYVTIDSAGIYMVEIKNSFGCIDKDSIAIVKIKPSIDIPNLITPNGDNYNDFFFIGDSKTKLTLSIYNCWGQLVYNTSDYKNTWSADGLNSGIYYYLIKDELECIGEHKGWLHVIK